MMKIPLGRYARELEPDIANINRLLLLIIRGTHRLPDDDVADGTELYLTTIEVQDGITYYPGFYCYSHERLAWERILEHVST